MEILHVRRVGNSLGIILPRRIVEEKGLRLNGEIMANIDKGPSLESVRGSIEHLGLTVDELNDLTNEGEEL